MELTEDEMVRQHHQLNEFEQINMSLSKLLEIVKDREAWCATVHRGHKESDTT